MLMYHALACFLQMSLRDHSMYWSKKLSNMKGHNPTTTDTNAKWLVVIRNISINCSETMMTNMVAAEGKWKTAKNSEIDIGSILDHD